MPKRTQSPSSINMYKQCPRRYFYRYILKYPVKTNIHCVRGTVVHSALENFYDLKPEALDPLGLKKELAGYLKNLFDAHWNKSKPQLSKLGMSADDLQFYYDDSVQQLANWLNHFFVELDSQMKNADFITAWNNLLPHARELKYKSDAYDVMGYVDAIYKEGEDITVVDYKTSKKFDITAEYKLQLGIYALLYEDKHGFLPQKVGIWFLKDRLKVIDVDEDMVKNAKFEIEQIHFATETKEITDYRKKPGPLCKYSTGQCDFYDVCRPYSDK